MRWNDLFADLEAQADALEAAERAAEVDERARSELGRLTAAGRLRGALGSTVALTLHGGLTVPGRLDRVGPDWLLVDEGGGREAVVVSAAVLTVSGAGRFADAAPLGVVAGRLGLRSVLRGLARDRSNVRVHLMDGQVLDATIDRVGADFIEAARHPVGEPRRRGDVRDVVLVPFGALCAVRRGAD